MNFRILSRIAYCIAGLIVAWPAAAQPTSRFNFNLGGGWTEPMRYSGRRMDRGFNMNFGAGVNFAPQVGVIGELGYNRLGLTSTALAAAGVPSGGMRLLSVTLNPIIRFNPHGRMDAYLVGGGGFYRRTIEFTEPTISTVTVFDPFYGVFYPAAIPANNVLGSFVQNRGGLNAGAGVSVRVRGDSNTKFYAEARYHYAFTSPVRTTVLPVTFGFRW